MPSSKTRSAPDDKTCDQAWTDIMKIASDHALIFQAYGGTAILASAASQRRSRIRNDMLAKEVMKKNPDPAERSPTGHPWRPEPSAKACAAAWATTAEARTANPAPEPLGTSEYTCTHPSELRVATSHRIPRLTKSVLRCSRLQPALTEASHSRFWSLPRQKRGPWTPQNGLYGPNSGLFRHPARVLSSDHCAISLKFGRPFRLHHPRSTARDG